jgi:hypothetical protein
MLFKRDKQKYSATTKSRVSSRIIVEYFISIIIHHDKIVFQGINHFHIVAKSKKVFTFRCLRLPLTRVATVVHGTILEKTALRAS